MLTLLVTYSIRTKMDQLRENHTTNTRKKDFTLVEILYNRESFSKLAMKKSLSETKECCIFLNILPLKWSATIEKQSNAKFKTYYGTLNTNLLLLKCKSKNNLNKNKIKLLWKMINSLNFINAIYLICLPSMKWIKI